MMTFRKFRQWLADLISPSMSRYQMVHIGGQISRKKADEFARSMAPMIAELQVAGIVSIIDTMHELNNRSIKSRQGRKWCYESTKNVLNRIKRL